MTETTARRLLRARRSRGPGPTWSALVGLLALLPAGCAGPLALRETRGRYQESYQRTTDEQWLMNLVRLRYADPPTFIDVPQITSQYELAGIGEFRAGRGGEIEGSTALGRGEVALRDSPTLSYQPQSGSEWARALVSPVSLELLLLTLTPNVEQSLTLVTRSMNEVDNALSAEVVNPRQPSSNDEFRHVLRMIERLFAMKAADLVAETRERDVSGRIPAFTVTGEDRLKAAMEGFTFQESLGDGMMVLLRDETTLALRVKPEFARSFEMMEIARVLGLTPGRLEYEVVPEIDRHRSALPRPLPVEDVIAMRTRSVLEIMIFLSKGVVVPPGHLADRLAPTLPGPGGRPYDWTRITRGLFRVCVSEQRPDAAAVAVKYKGRWFFIDERDAASKATLQQLQLIYNLQKQEAASVGPLLTLPVGF